MSDIAGEVPPSTPVSVITGFLGSGKTTLLSRLLADPRMCKAAVIINEFGEVGLDHLLVTSPREDVTLLSSGCLCCSLRGDLINTLTQLFNERARGEIPDFDRVLVETTGLADPAPVLLTVSADERLSEVFHIERVITTVDAAHGIGQLDSQTDSVKQACVADILLLTKTDVAAAGEVAALRARLNRLNPIAHTQDVVHGEIDPDWLFNIAAPGAPRLRDFGGLTGQVDAHAGHRHDHAHHHDGDAHGDIRSFLLQPGVNRTVAVKERFPVRLLLGSLCDGLSDSRNMRCCDASNNSCHGYSSPARSSISLNASSVIPLCCAPSC